MVEGVWRMDVFCPVAMWKIPWLTCSAFCWWHDFANLYLHVPEFQKNTTLTASSPPPVRHFLPHEFPVEFIFLQVSAQMPPPL